MKQLLFISPYKYTFVVHLGRHQRVGIMLLMVTCTLFIKPEFTRFSPALGIPVKENTTALVAAWRRPKKGLFQRKGPGYGRLSPKKGR